MLLVSYFRGYLFFENHEPCTFPKQTKKITIYAITASSAFSVFWPQILFCISIIMLMSTWLCPVKIYIVTGFARKMIE